MRPNANQLAMRDPAIAALLGAIPGVNSGAQSNFGAEFGDEWGSDIDVGAEFGFDPYGAEFGADFGAAAPAKITPNSPAGQAALAKMWNQNVQRANASKSRERVLEPNKGSALKVERYTFALSQSITLNGSVANLSLSGQPSTTIRPQRMTTNAPTPMFAFLQTIQVANVNVTVGTGFEDAYDFNSNSWNTNLDMPTLSPANRASVIGSYSGYIPPGFPSGFVTNFVVSFKGPATIVA